MSFWCVMQMPYTLKCVRKPLKFLQKRGCNGADDVL